MAKGRRVLAASTLALIVVLGVWWSGRWSRSVRARSELLAADQRTTADLEEIRRVIELRTRFDPQRVAVETAQDAERLGLSAEAAAELGDAQTHRRLLDEPEVLRAGQEWRVFPLRVRASHEKVRYQQHGATVAAKHLVATVENVGARPIAYFLVLRSEDRGRCDVRGARMHNAMALMPGERAEVVVCAGGGKLRIERAEVLEVGALGYFYLSMVSPHVVGHDRVVTSSHAPDRRAPRCTQLDAAQIESWVRDGLTRWVDVVDFFSRHHCDRFPFFLEYRYREGPRTVPAEPAGAEPQP